VRSCVPSREEKCFCVFVTKQIKQHHPGCYQWQLRCRLEWSMRAILESHQGQIHSVRNYKKHRCHHRGSFIISVSSSMAGIFSSFAVLRSGDLQRMRFAQTYLIAPGQRRCSHSRIVFPTLQSWPVKKWSTCSQHQFILSRSDSTNCRTFSTSRARLRTMARIASASRIFPKTKNRVVSPVRNRNQLFHSRIFAARSHSYPQPKLNPATKSRTVGN